MPERKFEVSTLASIAGEGLYSLFELHKYKKSGAITSVSDEVSMVGKDIYALGEEIVAWAASSKEYKFAARAGALAAGAIVQFGLGIKERLED